jgi:hypothetical protein
MVSRAPAMHRVFRINPSHFFSHGYFRILLSVFSRGLNTELDLGSAFRHLRVHDEENDKKN